MKKMLSFAICAIMMAVCSTAVQAQTEQSKKQRLSREELAEKQARHIAHELALDDVTSQKYVDTYKACQQEVWALGPKVKRHQADTATEAAKGVGRANHDGETNAAGSLQRVVHVLNGMTDRHFQTHLSQFLDKQVAVLGVHDGLDAGAQHLYAILL